GAAIQRPPRGEGAAGGGGMRRTLTHLAALCGGRFAGEDREWTDVNNDTRTLKPGQVYLALRGPRFDGNDFLEAAAEAGAVAAIIDRPNEAPPLPVIKVDDGQAALTRAARGWRAVRRAGGRRGRQQRQDHHQ